MNGSEEVDIVDIVDIVDAINKQLWPQSVRLPRARL